MVFSENLETATHIMHGGREHTITRVLLPVT